MEISIRPKTLAVTLLWIVAALTVIHCIVLVLYFTVDYEQIYGLVELFDFAIEHNVPTFYSAVAILLASAQLALIARANWRNPDGQRGYWTALSLLFLFLAFDEAVAIHEWIGDIFEEYFESEQILEATSYLYFMWVVPYGVATIALGVVFLRFVLSLPAETRNRFIAAGVIFIGAAVGLEMLGAREADMHDTDTLLYSILYTFEELFEMLGIVLFNYALLSYLTETHGAIRLVLEPSKD